MGKIEQKRQERVKLQQETGPNEIGKELMDREKARTAAE